MSARLEGLWVVTGASSNHFGALQYLLRSLDRAGATVRCYDLGLTPRELGRLHRFDGFELRRFDFAAYPPHVDIRINAGEYAWKPAIIAEVVEESRRLSEPRDVLWADAGCYVETLEIIARKIRECGGLFACTSSGTMRDWTHPGMFEYLAADGAEYADRPNAQAGLVGFATGSASPAEREAVYERIVVPWRHYALIKECIAPPGSSRENHRQDQALLSYLVHRAGYALVPDRYEQLGVRCQCDRWFYRFIGFRLFPPSVYARFCLH